MHYCPKSQIDASLCFIWVLCAYSNSLVLQMLFFTSGINITWELFRNLNYQSLQGMGPSNPCFVFFKQELFHSMRLGYCDSDTHHYRIFSHLLQRTSTNQNNQLQQNYGKSPEEQSSKNFPCDSDAHKGLMTTVIATTEKEEAEFGLFNSKVGSMPISWGIITQEEERCSDVE